MGVPLGSPNAPRKSRASGLLTAAYSDRSETSHPPKLKRKRMSAPWWRDSSQIVCPVDEVGLALPSSRDERSLDGCEATRQIQRRWIPAQFPSSS
jgi:hypothetical protein